MQYDTLETQREAARRSSTQRDSRHAGDLHARDMISQLMGA